MGLFRKSNPKIIPVSIEAAVKDLKEAERNLKETLEKVTEAEQAKQTTGKVIQPILKRLEKNHFADAILATFSLDIKKD